MRDPNRAATFASLILEGSFISGRRIGEAEGLGLGLGFTAGLDSEGAGPYSTNRLTTNWLKTFRLKRPP